MTPEERLILAKTLAETTHIILCLDLWHDFRARTLRSLAQSRISFVLVLLGVTLFAILQMSTAVIFGPLCLCTNLWLQSATKAHLKATEAHLRELREQWKQTKEAASALTFPDFGTPRVEEAP